jgi:hypothetical protein
MKVSPGLPFDVLDLHARREVGTARRLSPAMLTHAVVRSGVSIGLWAGPYRGSAFRATRIASEIATADLVVRKS